MISYSVCHLLCIDNFVIFLRGSNLNEIEPQLQKVVMKLSIWGINNRLNFALHQNKIDKFFKKKGLSYVRIILNCEEIPQVTNTKFLVLIFNSHLKWHLHIKELKQKYLSQLNILKMLNSRAWGSEKNFASIIQKSCQSCSRLQMYYLYRSQCVYFKNIRYDSKSGVEIMYRNLIQRQPYLFSTSTKYSQSTLLF